MKPSASAPASVAARASAVLVMPQILTIVLMFRCPIASSLIVPGANPFLPPGAASAQLPERQFNVFFRYGQTQSPFVRSTEPPFRKPSPPPSAFWLQPTE